MSPQYSMKLVYNSGPKAHGSTYLYNQALKELKKLMAVPFKLTAIFARSVLTNTTCRPDRISWDATSNALLEAYKNTTKKLQIVKSIPEKVRELKSMKI
jgi:hypothetical protein